MYYYWRTRMSAFPECMLPIIRANIKKSADIGWGVSTRFDERIHVSDERGIFRDERKIFTGRGKDMLSDCGKNRNFADVFSDIL